MEIGRQRLERCRVSIGGIKRSGRSAICLRDDGKTVLSGVFEREVTLNMPRPARPGEIPLAIELTDLSVVAAELNFAFPFFGDVKGAIGDVNQIFDFPAVLRIKGDADAQIEGEMNMFADLLYPSSNAGGGHPNAISGRLWKNDHDFISSPAKHEIGSTRGILDQSGDPL